MTLRPDYVTPATVKDYLRIGAADTVDDLVIAMAVTAASRAVDHACGRQFGLAETAETRVYRSRPAGGRGGLFDGRGWVEIDDLMTTTDLAVAALDDADDGDGTVAEAFDLWPWNAAGDGEPWTHVVFRPGVFVSGLRRVEVTGRWGWTAVPPAVSQATLLQVSRWYKRRDAPFGIAGSAEIGSELRLLARLDPDVAVIVEMLARPSPLVA